MAKINPIRTLATIKTAPKSDAREGVFKEGGRGRRQCEGCGNFITSSYRKCPVCGQVKVFQTREKKNAPISANVFAIVKATVGFLQSQDNDANRALATLEAVQGFVEVVGGWENAQQAIESFAGQGE